jgi:tetratricopeptide (TPR) repeat protein
VALLDLETSTLNTSDVQALSQVLWARLNIKDGFRLLEREPARRLLIRNDLFPFTPYRPVVPPASVLRALGANYLVTGHIDQIDGAFLMDVSVYSAPAAKYVLLDAQQRQATMDQMLVAMDDLATMVHTAIAQDEYYFHPEAPEALEAPHRPSSIPLKQAPDQFRPRRRASSAAAAKPAKAARRRGARHQPEEAGETLPPPLKTEGRATSTPTPETTPEATPSPTPQAERPRGGAEELAEASRLYREALRLKEKSAERLEKLSQAVALAPNTFLYQYQLAMEYYLQNKFKECVAQCERALRIKPNNSVLYTIAGSAYFELGRYEEAHRAFATALTTDPGNDWARYNVALTLEMLKAPEEAQAWRDYLARAQGKASQQALVEKARQRLAMLESATNR